MKKVWRSVAVVFGLVLLAGAIAGVLSTSAYSKPPKPKCPNCAPTITLPDGRVCTLEACGSDCVYTCPF